MKSVELRRLPSGIVLRKGVRSVVCVAVAASVMASLPASATAFGTINLLGQNAEHGRITRASLACSSAASPAFCFSPVSIDQLAGKFGTFGAVGAPDADPALVLAAEAHCDAGDYLDVPGYPRTRAEADDQLLACRSYAKGRFSKAVDYAAGLLDSSGSIRASAVSITWLTPCSFVPVSTGRAKCNVLGEFGGVLHAVEDFYAHSNWADRSDAANPVGLSNAPGLHRADLPNLLALRTAVAGPIPPDLSSACFALPWETKCNGRVTHEGLNKDTGTIDPVTGAATDPTTARGAIASNFQDAVRGAIADAKRQWTDLKYAIQAKYGLARAGKMICALTNDSPKSRC